MTGVLAYIGLGSNVGDREAYIRRALAELARHDRIDVESVSRLRETEPWGYVDQPAFLNGACTVRTSLSPGELLDVMLDVERRLGRRRGRRWGPRVIDLDLLLFGSERIEQEGLAVPHPRLAEREFVLEPLLDLDPALRLPDGSSVRDLLATARR